MSAAIAAVQARRVWDSRGRPTLEAEVTLANGATGRAIAPAGASTGAGEAHELRDGGRAFGGLDVQRAITGVNGEIAQALRGLAVAAQADIDRCLIALDGTPERRRLGANALVAVSMACAHAAAASAGVPLWRLLAGERPAGLPVPQIQIYGGGAHAGGRVDLQDYLLVCPGAGSFAESLEWAAEVYRAAGERLKRRGVLAGVADEGGWWPSFRTNEEGLEALVQAIGDAGLRPGTDAAIALDIAATQLRRDGRYQLALEGRALTAEQWSVQLRRWLDRYPIVSIEDPFAEDDAEAMREFTRAAGDRVQVIGDDFFASDAHRIATADGACNAVLLKPNQTGTLTETHAAWQAAKAQGYGGVVSARSGESEDVTIVHLAVGWGVPQLKVGSFARSERMAKWNEGLRIEASLGARALPFPASRLFRRSSTS